MAQKRPKYKTGEMVYILPMSGGLGYFAKVVKIVKVRSDSLYYSSCVDFYYKVVDKLCAKFSVSENSIGFGMLTFLENLI